MMVIFLIAFVVAIIAGKLLIPALKRLKFGQEVREDGPKNHLSKQGTPTMGGIIMIIAILVAVLVMAIAGFDIHSKYSFVYLSLFSMLGFGLVGFLDDFIKIKKKRSLGLRSYQKLIAQFILAAVIAVSAYLNPYIGSSITIPFVNIEWDLGIFYIPIAMIFLVGLVNAVNLTDGLDGLATSVTFVNAIAYAIFLTIFSNNITQMVKNGTNTGTADYLWQILMLQNFVMALAGACLGFLWVNSYPASVFMGDTGSMALGGALCGIMLTTRTMLMVFIVGIMFVCSAVSVVLQVGSYKLRNKKRIFLMAPLHHHFELKGFPEAKIVSWYTIITVLGGALLIWSGFLQAG